MAARAAFSSGFPQLVTAPRRCRRTRGASAARTHAGAHRRQTRHTRSANVSVAGRTGTLPAARGFGDATSLEAANEEAVTGEHGRVAMKAPWPASHRFARIPRTGGLPIPARGKVELRVHVRGGSATMTATDVRKLIDQGVPQAQIVTRLERTGIWSEAGAREIVRFMTTGPDSLLAKHLRLVHRRHPTSAARS